MTANDRPRAFRSIQHPDPFELMACVSQASAGVVQRTLLGIAFRVPGLDEPGGGEWRAFLRGGAGQRPIYCRESMAGELAGLARVELPMRVMWRNPPRSDEEVTILVGVMDHFVHRASGWGWLYAHGAD